MSLKIIKLSFLKYFNGNKICNCYIILYDYFNIKDCIIYLNNKYFLMSFLFNLNLVI